MVTEVMQCCCQQAGFALQGCNWKLAACCLRWFGCAVLQALLMSVVSYCSRQSAVGCAQTSFLLAVGGSVGAQTSHGCRRQIEQDGMALVQVGLLRQPCSLVFAWAGYSLCSQVVGSWEVWTGHTFTESSLPMSSSVDLVA